MLVAVLSLIGAVALSIYVDTRPSGYTTVTADSIERLWTIGSSALTFLFGLVSGKRL